MARSTALSEPLTSPTPSPPPSNVPPPKPSSSASAPPAGFDSELSELSDDDNDDGKQPHTDEYDREKSTGSERTRTRRKRGGVVPGDMWDWAYKVKKNVPNPDQEEDVEDQDGRDEDTEAVGSPEKENGLYNNDPPLEADGSHGKENDEDIEEGEICARPTRKSTSIERDPGKGEDDMDIDSSEENPENPPVTTSGSVAGDVADEDIQSESGGEEDGQEDDNEPEEEEVDEDDNAENSVNEDEDDIASSRPSSSPPSDLEVDEPLPLPVKAQSSMSLIPPAATKVAVGVTPDGSPSSEPEELPVDQDGEVDVEQEEDPVDVEQEDDAVENGDTRARTEGKGQVEAEVDVASATPEHSSRSPTLEPDLLDFQPAHRAEALDALALIELKFALLRERLYVEKMEELVEEEGMILNGTHPELIHLQMELSTRRDKRLQLALRRKQYDEASIKRKRLAAQNGVWEWWKYESELVQKELIASHNRKRRKLQRQRQAHDRVPPIRHIPAPSLAVLPPPPSLSAILEINPSVPYASMYGIRPIRPSVSVLSAAEVERDLSYISGGKRRFWSTDGPGGGPNEGMPSYMNGATTNGDHARDMKDRERERVQRNTGVFETLPGQNFRPMGMNQLTGEDMNGWNKRRIDEEMRVERDRERERTGQRQTISSLHSHALHVHHTIHPHQHISFQPQHPHTHPAHLHSHPHPHHHHVHVHHHHHSAGLVAPGLPPPQQGGPPRREHSYSQSVHAGPGIPEKPFGHHDDKMNSGSFWRREDDISMGSMPLPRERDRDREREHERDRDRERERDQRDREREHDRDRDRDRRAPGMEMPHGGPLSLHGQGPPGGYERAPYVPGSPRRHDSWDDARLAPPSARLPPPHVLSRHGPPGSISGGGSSPSRRQPPPSPPHSHSMSAVFPASPRSVTITPVPVGPTSRAISPVPAKIGPGGSYRGLAESFGMRGEMYEPGGRRDQHQEARPIALSLNGVSGGSTTDGVYASRRERY